MGPDSSFRASSRWRPKVEFMGFPGGDHRHGAIRHHQHPHAGSGRARRVGQNDARGSLARQGGRDPGHWKRRARHHGKRLRSTRKDLETFSARVGAAPRDAGHAVAHDRYAGISRLHRPIDRRTRCGGDRRHRGERLSGDRNDHLAHDGVGRYAQALSAAGRQQDRRREHRFARSPRRHPCGVRQGMPADQSARRGR